MVRELETTWVMELREEEQRRGEEVEEHFVSYTLVRDLTHAPLDVACGRRVCRQDL